jgi:hypothetical protein
MTQKNLFNIPKWIKGDQLILDGRQVFFEKFSPSNDKFQVTYTDMHEGGKLERWHPIAELPDKPTPPTAETTSPLHVPTDEDDTNKIVVGQLRACHSDRDVPYIEITEDRLTRWQVKRTTISETHTEILDDDEIERKWWRLLKDVPLIGKEVKVGQYRKKWEDKEYPYMKVLENLGDGFWRTLSVWSNDLNNPNSQREYTKSTYRIRTQYPNVIDPPAKPDDDQKPPIADAVEAVNIEIEKVTNPTDDTPTPIEEIIMAVPAPQPEDDDDDDCTGEPVPMQRERMIEHFVIRDKSGFHTDKASARLNTILKEGYRLENIEYSHQYRPHADGGYVETVVFWTFLRWSKAIG